MQQMYEKIQPLDLYFSKLLSSDDALLYSHFLSGNSISIEFDINGILQYYFLEGENVVLPCPYLWLQKAKQSLTDSCFPLVFHYLSFYFESPSALLKTSQLYSLKLKLQSRNKYPNLHHQTTALHSLPRVQRSF